MEKMERATARPQTGRGLDVRKIAGLTLAMLVFVLACFGLVGTPDNTNPSGAPKVGQPVPDFTLGSLDGGAISVSQFRDRPVLINFWATWCAPCRAEMPALQAVYEKYQARGFVVLAVNATHIDADPDIIRAFRDEFKLSFPVLLDSAGRVSDQFLRPAALPTSVFVDRHGTVTFIQLGAMTRDFIEQQLAKIL